MPIPLSAAKPVTHNDRVTYLTIDIPEHDCSVVVAPGPYVVLKIGHRVKDAGARFQHPNVIDRVRLTDYWFKHSSNSGSKHWTTTKGVDHYFVFPKEIVLLDDSECGYSYPNVIINGQKIRLNVSGGGGGGAPGWTDWISGITETSIGYPVRVLKALAEVAVLLPDLVIPTHEGDSLLTVDELKELIEENKPKSAQPGDVVIVSPDYEPRAFVVEKSTKKRNGHTVYISDIAYNRRFRFMPKDITEVHSGLSITERIAMLEQYNAIDPAHAAVMRSSIAARAAGAYA